MNKAAKISDIFPKFMKL